MMKLLRKYLVDSIERTTKNNMRVRVIGEKSRLSEDIREAIEKLEKVSAANTGLNFTIALNYGSRDEMVRAMRRMRRIAARMCCVRRISRKRFLTPIWIRESCRIRI